MAIKAITKEEAKKVTISQIFDDCYAETFKAQGVAPESVQYKEMRKCFFLAFDACLFWASVMADIYDDDEDSAIDHIQRLKDEKEREYPNPDYTFHEGHEPKQP